MMERVSKIARAAIDAHIKLEEGEGLSFYNIFKEGAYWMAKEVIRNVKRASDNFAFAISNNLNDEASLIGMTYCESVIQQILDLMREDAPIYQEDVLKE